MAPGRASAVVHVRIVHAWSPVGTLSLRSRMLVWSLVGLVNMSRTIHLTLPYLTYDGVESRIPC